MTDKVIRIKYKYPTTKGLPIGSGIAISNVIRIDEGIGYVVETPWGREYVLLKEVIEVLE